MLASPASAARRSSRFHTRPDLPISTKSFASSVATRSESTRHAGSSNSRSNATTLSTSSKPPIVLRLPNLRAPESAANVRCARLPKECCHSIRPRVTAAQRRSGVRLQGMRIAEIGHSTRSTRSRERGSCQRTTCSGGGFDQRCRHRRTSATSPPSIWSASPTAPACPPTNERTAAVQPSAADPARTRRPATFATPTRSCSASATTSANVGNTVRTAASGRPDRDRTAIERPSRLTYADLVEFTAPEPATVPTMALLPSPSLPSPQLEDEMML